MLRGLSRFKFLLVIIFIALLSAQSIENAFAGTWIIYDDNTRDTHVGFAVGVYMGVKFTLPSGETAALLTARFWLQTWVPMPYCVEVHVFDASGYTDLTTPITYGTLVGEFDQFFNLDLSSLGITVGKEFWIALIFKETSHFNVNLGLDTGSSYGRSYYATSPPSWNSYPGNFIIRAEVDPIMKPVPSGPQHVGGEIFAANKLAMLSPYLALIGLVAVAAIFAKRRLT